MMTLEDLRAMTKGAADAKETNRDQKLSAVASEWMEEVAKQAGEGQWRATVRLPMDGNITAVEVMRFMPKGMHHESGLSLTGSAVTLDWSFRPPSKR